MKLIFLLPVAAVFLTSLGATARADDPKDALVAAEKAGHDAPGYRIKATSTDVTTKAVTTMTVEVVKPETMHLKSESGGKSMMEVYSDGQKVFFSQGGGPMQAAPPQVSVIMQQMREQMSGEAVAKLAQNVKLAGHDNVGGTPATIYSFDADMMGMHMVSKEWVSDKDQRPLRLESATSGTISGRTLNRNTTVTYEYDPSIKVTMPQG